VIKPCEFLQPLEMVVPSGVLRQPHRQKAASLLLPCETVNWLLSLPKIRSYGRSISGSREGEIFVGPWASLLALPGHELSAAWGRSADRLRHGTINKEKGSCLGGSAFVAVVKSTDLGYGHDWPHFHRLNRSRLGRILG
jgi:hypothetical protein